MSTTIIDTKKVTTEVLPHITQAINFLQAASLDSSTMKSKLPTGFKYYSNVSTLVNDIPTIKDYVNKAKGKINEKVAGANAINKKNESRTSALVNYSTVGEGINPTTMPTNSILTGNISNTKTITSNTNSTNSTNNSWFEDFLNNRLNDWDKFKDWSSENIEAGLYKLGELLSYTTKYTGDFFADPGAFFADLYDKSTDFLASHEELLDIANEFARVGADITNVFISFAFGVGEFFESVSDTLIELFTGLASLGTAAYDVYTGITTNDWSLNTTNDIWDITKSVVSEDIVSGWKEKFYNGYGSILDEYAHGAFKSDGFACQVSQQIGYFTTMIATGKLVSTGLGALSTAGEGSKVLNFFLDSNKGAKRISQAITFFAGIGKNSEEAWNDGADTADGLLYSGLRSAYETFEIGLGYAINGVKFGGKFLTSGLHVILDTADGASGAFADTTLKMLYTPNEKNISNIMQYTDGTKNWGDLTFSERWSAIFKSEGGWTNVLQQAAVGAGLSVGGEVFDHIGSGTKGSKSQESSVISKDTDNVINTKGLKTKAKEFGTKLKDGFNKKLTNAKITKECIAMISESKFEDATTYIKNLDIGTRIKLGFESLTNRFKNSEINVSLNKNLTADVEVNKLNISNDVELVTEKISNVKSIDDQLYNIEQYLKRSPDAFGAVRVEKLDDLTYDHFNRIGKENKNNISFLYNGKNYSYDDMVSIYTQNLNSARIDENIKKINDEFKADIKPTDQIRELNLQKQKITKELEMKQAEFYEKYTNATEEVRKLYEAGESHGIKIYGEIDPSVDKARRELTKLSDDINYIKAEGQIIDNKISKISLTESAKSSKKQMIYDNIDSAKGKIAKDLDNIKAKYGETKSIVIDKTYNIGLKTKAKVSSILSTVGIQVSDTKTKFKSKLNDISNRVKFKNSSSVEVGSSNIETKTIEQIEELNLQKQKITNELESKQAEFYEKYTNSTEEVRKLYEAGESHGIKIYGEVDPSVDKARRELTKLRSDITRIELEGQVIDDKISKINLENLTEQYKLEIKKPTSIQKQQLKQVNNMCTKRTGMELEQIYFQDEYVVGLHFTESTLGDTVLANGLELKNTELSDAVLLMDGEKSLNGYLRFLDKLQRTHGYHGFNNTADAVIVCIPKKEIDSVSDLLEEANGKFKLNNKYILGYTNVSEGKIDHINYNSDSIGYNSPISNIINKKNVFSTRDFRSKALQRDLDFYESLPSNTVIYNKTLGLNRIRKQLENKILEYKLVDHSSSSDETVYFKKWFESDGIDKINSEFGSYISEEKLTSLKKSFRFFDEETLRKICNSVGHQNAAGFSDGEVIVEGMLDDVTVGELKHVTLHESIHHISWKETFSSDSDIKITQLGFHTNIYRGGKVTTKYFGLNEATTEYLCKSINGIINCESGYDPAVFCLSDILNLNIEGLNNDVLKQAYFNNDVSPIAEAIDKVVNPGYFESKVVPAFDKAIEGDTLDLDRVVTTLELLTAK